MDIDAAGGVATGGLIAGAIEKPTGQAGEAHHGACSDCGAAVEGKFCSNCGQPTHVHRSLLHLGEELLHGVMHFDARIWRTLPLLAFNPGRLTREWVQGKRTRYVSPLALFLFTVFLMFFILSFAGGGGINYEPLPQRIEFAQAEVAENRQEVDTAAADLAVARTAGGDDEAVALETYAEAVNDLAAETERLSALRRTAATPRTDGLVAGSWQAEIADAGKQGKTQSDIGGIGDKLLKKMQNPDLAFYKLQQTMYKYAFLLVPLSIPFVGLLFLWKRGFTWYDHGVFVLYSLTFIAILGMVVVGLARANVAVGGVATAIGTFWVPVHMFFQLKGAYGLSIFSALWRSFLLLNFCAVVLTLFTLAVLYLGLGI